LEELIASYLPPADPDVATGPFCGDCGPESSYENTGVFTYAESYAKPAPYDPVISKDDMLASYHVLPEPLRFLVIHISF
jgi:hypothetical protein